MHQSVLRRWLIPCSAVALILALVGATLGNDLATRWLEGPKFREMLGHETSKGLKLKGEYSPLHRVGLLGVRTDSFHGTDGAKAIVSLDAHDVTASFNPLGIYLRRWQVQSVHIASGTVTIQKTEATPGAPKGRPWPPWWAIFWPYRVQLQDVKCDDTDVLFKLRDKEAGIYHAFLEITPNGYDYEYDGRGGEFRTPLTPKLNLNHIHMLIRKPRLYCTAFVLGDDPAHPEQQLRINGDAGLQDDRSMNLKAEFERLNIAPWLPEKTRSHVEGRMSGRLDFTSTGSGLESGHGSGAIDAAGTVLRNVAPIHQYITITGSPDPGPFTLKVCHADLKLDAGALTATNIEAEAEGIFRITGSITLAADKTLSGQVELGLTDAYLKWLPTARSAIFSHDEGPYHFTTIHFSGTTQKPVQDLTPRIAKEIEKSPLVAMKLFFNSAGAWFDAD